LHETCDSCTFRGDQEEAEEEEQEGRRRKRRRFIRISMIL
jgi:hypothetical protein